MFRFFSLLKFDKNPKLVDKLPPALTTSRDIFLREE